MEQVNEAVVRRIRALMARTVENGATEAEAASFAAAAQRLMNEHNLSLSDIKLKETANCREEATFQGFRSDPASYRCAVAIAHLTDTRVWIKTQGGVGRLVFFGMDTGVIVAHYVYSVIDRAITYEWIKFSKESGFHGAPKKQQAAIKEGFLTGMTSRLNDRLYEIKAAERRANSATGRDLVISIAGIVDAEMKKRGITLGKGKARRGGPIDGDAYRAGRAAGDTVALNKGVGASGGGSQPKIQ